MRRDFFLKTLRDLSTEERDEDEEGGEEQGTCSAAK
jgi:hypothetical protein